MIVFIIFCIIWAFIVGITGIIAIIKDTSRAKEYVERVQALVSIPLAIVPLIFINNIYKDNGIIIFILLIVFGFVLTRIGINIYNKLKVNISKDKGIYIRDIDVKYSPAVLSFLQNQKIEKDKDITATILDLCAKKYLNIKRDEENRYSLEIGTNHNIEELPIDEKYLYDRIIKKEELKFNKWREIVLKEFNEYKFLRKSKIKLSSIFLYLYISIMTLLTILVLSQPNFEFESQNINFIYVFILFFANMELVCIEPIMKIIIEKLQVGEYISGIYTIAGAKEMTRWDKYKSFLQNYTLIKDNKIDSVIVLEKHMAYATVLNINKDYTKSIINELNINYGLDISFIKEIIK